MKKIVKDHVRLEIRLPDCKFMVLCFMFSVVNGETCWDGVICKDEEQPGIYHCRRCNIYCFCKVYELLSYLGTS